MTCRCYGPGLAVSRLHDDRCPGEIRGQHSRIAEIDGAPGPVVQAVAEAPGEAPGEAEEAWKVEWEGPGPGLVRSRAHE